jgi:quinol monooxygenase YgiN
VIIIEGTLIGSAESIDDLIRMSLEHVRRSRLEPGCISHGVARDVENPLRLVFAEQWEDMAAVLAHFAVPESGAFVRAAQPLVTSPPTIELYEATPTTAG